ncbi:hypothetical protein [Crassaminicella profunda]|uniref:hypothetical protein n=1 Tax=Crassaminicella profunda TaxID=1286698 RepID=UPI001CA6CE13|nr:hypothetical protein [Crassaminicella profunda]QZY53897.1 hypothetical protein K7H06_12625 [Crassaminicella profunda]
MSNKKTLSPQSAVKLKELVQNNTNPREISRILADEYNEHYCYQTITRKIKKLYNKYWDTQAKPKKYKPILDGPIQYSFFEGDAHNSKNFTTKSDEPEQTPSDKTDSTILDYLKSIDKKLSYLDTRLTRIENFIEKNSSQAKKDLTNSFIEIYSCNRKRESVNINAKIKKRIIEKMAQTKNITHNQSLAINTALLIALYEEE